MGTRVSLKVPGLKTRAGQYFPFLVSLVNFVVFFNYKFEPDSYRVEHPKSEIIKNHPHS